MTKKKPSRAGKAQPVDRYGRTALEADLAALRQRIRSADEQQGPAEWEKFTSKVVTEFNIHLRLLLLGRAADEVERRDARIQLQGDGGESLAALAAAADSAAAVSVIVGEVMAEATSAGQHHIATVLKDIATWGAAEAVLPSTLAVADVLTPDVISGWLANVEASLEGLCLDLSLAASSITTVYGMLQLPSVVGALGQAGVLAVHQSLLSSRTMIWALQQAQQYLAAAAAGAVPVAAPVGASSSAGQHQQAPAQHQQQQEVGRSAAAVGRGMSTELGGHCALQVGDAAAGAEPERGPGRQQVPSWSSTALGALTQQPSPAAATAAPGPQMIGSTGGLMPAAHLRLAAPAAARQGPAPAAQPRKKASVSGTVAAAAASAGVVAATAAGAHAGGVAAAAAAADPVAVFEGFEAVCLEEEQLRAVFEATGSKVLTLRSSAAALQPGQSQFTQRVFEMSVAGLSQLEEVMPAVRVCSSKGGVNLDHDPRKHRVTATATFSSSDSEQRRQQLVHDAVLWVLVLLWCSVPAEQHAKYSSWAPLREALAAAGE